jgi:N-acetylmuramoyl-L-alanine amidase
MKHKIPVVLLFSFVLANLPLFSSPFAVNIRSFDHKGFTRIVFEGDEVFGYKYNASRSGIELRLNRKAAVKKQVEVFRRSLLLDRVVHHVESGSTPATDISIFQVHLKTDFDIGRHFVLERPFRVVFDLVKAPKKPGRQVSVQLKDTRTTQNKEEEKPPEPTGEQEEPPDTQIPPQPQSGEEKKPSLINTICIDPGHGGSDLGAVGRSKLTEKVITLKIGLKLKRLIESKLGLYVVMTREKDEEVSLNSRVSKANNQKAQLFVSIHVNSSFRRAARGPETFYVSLKATDQEAFRLSQKENRSFTKELDKLATDADDELKLILWSMAQTEYIKESSKLADFIQAELNILMDTANRGVKQAPFRVLMRAAMPAILVEVAFISNYSEEKKLADNSFADKIAGALYVGISKYIYYHNTLYR